ncbi:MAG: TRAP transporter substrate-binding protein [Clostridiales bacterium]|nr:TRAP transporter substrate-binding protein [Clostridiales bacterium]MCF8022047.1 TRAP transporter substrate-binding protein [Clostridiales bacterium]
MKKLFIALVVLLAVSVCAVGCGGNGDKSGDASKDKVYTLKIAHQASQTHPWQAASEDFKKKVEERTDGKVKVEIYYGGQLGNDRDLIEGLQAGTVDLAFVTNGPLAQFVPEIGVLDLPFIFSSWDQGFEFRNSEIAEDLASKLDSRNLEHLGFLSQGFRNLTNSVKPVKTPADIEGLKIRVMQSPVYIKTFNTLGASAVPMSWGEVYTSLQQGTIDGQENPLTVINSQKVYEVQEYLSLTGHTFSFTNLLGSKITLNKLPDEYKQIIQEVGEEATYDEMKNVQKDEKVLREKLENEYGMKVTEVNKEPFQEKVSPLYKEFSEEHGEKWVNGILDLQ